MTEMTPQEALSMIEGASIHRRIRNVSPQETLEPGWVLAEDLHADRDLPPFHRCMVDGYAVCSSDITEKGIREFRVVDTLKAGSTNQKQIRPGEALFIMTGAPVPDPLDMVLKKENVEVRDGMLQLLHEPGRPWLNVARQGEDAKRGEPLLFEGQSVSPSTIQIIAATGKRHIRVYEKPGVHLITTGDEVVSPWSADVKDDQIRDSSAPAITMLLQQIGIPLLSHTYCKDDPKELHEAIEQGIRGDVLLITGGVSMGVTDVIPQLLAQSGIEKQFHRLKIKPGRPLFFGTGPNGNAVFGLPGNPVSSQVTLRMFVFPWIRRFMGLGKETPFVLPLCADKKKNHDLEEYAQVHLDQSRGRSCLRFYDHHGSGDFTALRNTGGIMVHPADRSILREGEYVEYFNWSFHHL